jgi:arylsulfatase A-like enzyme/Tfp pilus assembly protein PilF
MRALRPLMALSLLVLGGCGEHDGGNGAARPDAPNVLLVTLDTTRADRVGCYGYSAAMTPTLDKLAADGVRFEHAYCQVPLTLPSHTTILTGLNPPTTGLHVNAAGALSEEVPTLAERFQARGYRTGAFIAAWVLHSRYGLSRGFERYDEAFGDAGDAGVGPTERRADAVCDAVIAWLNEAPQAPFFAWVHFFDPHAPYDPPPGFHERPADPYDGEIAFMDAQFQRLVDWLDSHGARDKTLIVAVGDHGEAFGEHGELGHGTLLYESTVRVPLIFGWPGKLPAGAIARSSARLVDLAPTILDLLDCAPLPDAQGESLRGALTSANDTWRPVYCETDYPLIGFGWAPLRSYATREWKYIEAPRPELYDWVNDPTEATNVIDEHPEVAATLKGELAALLARMPHREAVTLKLDDDALRSLESLGYVGGSVGDEVDRNVERKDPKDMTVVVRGLMRAKGLAVDGRHEEAIRALEPLAALSPESDELFGALAHAYLKLGRYSEAEKAYRASLRSVPTNVRRLCHLGDAIAAQNRPEEARKCYEEAVAADERYTPALSRLGRYHFQRKELGRAEAYFERCLALAPSSPSALANMGHVRLNTGDAKEAVALFRRALAQDPGHVPAHEGLWQALNASRQRLPAIEALRRACRAMPSKLSLRRHLAGLLATTPQLGLAAKREALELAKRVAQARPNAPENLDVLGLAFAVNGDFSRARQAARNALALAQKQGKQQLARQIAIRLRAYQAGRVR